MQDNEKDQINQQKHYKASSYAEENKLRFTGDQSQIQNSMQNKNLPDISQFDIRPSNENFE